ncbi:ATP-dependent DNA helicase [Nodularia phage vB_NspS-kac68v162]|jgi:hypothetical protein|uniref:ATP-dependent DNA helicase n=2 Tax=Ravarandavirus kac68v161 TaxID=2845690 RepID=A0A482MK73_9CAUD|nr:ATP-dependent DNA helicase [Nodularia phage vB_NspS-kac68v161]QBQ73802.1 ATP-dependent DNA helicase [Nodularia phage vB_NspS-kac68v161]QBQ73998.1 ATP-dependent DNA helicase [Nodularia phage vB_NspS-kac68v162]
MQSTQVKPDIKLNWQQQQALEFVVDQVLNSPNKYIGLYGTAGTGKTVTARYILEALASRMDKDRFLAITPTNSACKTLNKSFKGGTIRPDVITIASALRKKRVITESGGQDFVIEDEPSINDPFCDRYNPLEKVELLLGDELSMSSKYDMQKINDNLSYRAKVLVMMDIYQLFPPNENSIYAQEMVGNNFYQLTKTERYAEGSNIYKVITAAQQAVEHKNFNFNIMSAFPNSFPDGDKGAGYFVHGNENLGVMSFARQVKLMLAAQSWDYTRCVCWRNKIVDRVNFAVRQAIVPYGDQRSATPGELFITTGVVKRSAKGLETTLYQTATQLVIEQANPRKIADNDGDEWIIWDAVVYDPDDDIFNKPVHHNVTILDQYDRERFEAKLNNLGNSITVAAKEFGYKSFNWWKVYNHKEAFMSLVDPIRPSYAVTGYNAQGKSYKVMYVNYWHDIRFDRRDPDRRNRTVFVGASRAMKQLNIF